jgi:hypothetical protein
MALSQVRRHYGYETHISARERQKAQAHMGQQIAPSVHEQVVITPAIPSPDYGSHLTTELPHVHPDISMTPNTLLEDIEMQPGIPHASYAQLAASHTISALHDLEYDPGLIGDILNDDSNGDDDHQHFDLDDTELKELEDMLTGALHLGEQSYDPWPTKNVCDIFM